MTRKTGGLATTLALYCLSAPAFAQSSSDEPTLEERVALLEMSLAGLTSRFDLRSGLDDTSGDRTTMATRVTELERRVERLTADLQRIERQADTAMREATQARRDAIAAQQLARDAASRLR